MSVDDALSLSFASSMGIENIQDEYLDRSNLYTDLEQLEKSVDAEFEEYMNRARSFPFKEKQKSLHDASIHSDYEILGEELLDKLNENAQGDNNDSWQRYMDNKQSDEHYNVKPLRNTGSSAEAKSQSRSTSPGEYFGARSLPFNQDWRRQSQQQDDAEDEQEVDGTQSSYNSKDRQISLPKSLGVYPKYELPEIELHHPYTQRKAYSNRSSVSSTHQQCSSRQRDRQLQDAQLDNSDFNGAQSLSSNTPSSASSSNAPDVSYTIEPSSPLHFLCEISSKTIYAKVVYLRLQNLSLGSVKKFSLFSANNMLDFEMTNGLILEDETVEIKIKIRSGALVNYQRQQQQSDAYPSLSDKILVLIDHQHVNELDVIIDFMSLEDDEDEDEEEEEEEEKEQEPVENKEPLDEQALLQANRPKCRFCALEKGYPLYNL
ncbi:hypothetical protein [Parasitella parasitica]|uniref:Uncharacterized protein n=1 Tax=Parasitella parasitica TaxID=35722 RepID=A0A0B7NXI0_9FUNG|nr:hypothetical protein [Parasitella parasitica]